MGREKFVTKPEDYQEHLDGLIKSLELMERTEKCADFVTWRGIITKIICTPFKLNDSWNLNVMRRGVRQAASNCFTLVLFVLLFLEYNFY